MKLALLIYQRTGTGETLMALTISDGQRINISQHTAVHAGLMVLPQLLEIDLTFSSETKTQPQLIFPLKFSLIAEPEVLAMVETQVVSTNTLSNTVSPTHHANNTLQRILVMLHAHQLMSARIVMVPLQLKDKMDKKTARLLITRNTTFLTTTVYQVLIR
jgi:hypothetical protein